MVSKRFGLSVPLFEIYVLGVFQLKNQSPGFDSLAIRAGQQRTLEGEHSEAIFATSSFVFDNAQQAADRFGGEEPGNIYGRFTNPTVNAFERRLAALEQGEACIATATGMAAIMSVCVALLKQGDHIVSSPSIFGTTNSLFTKYLPRFGIETDFVDITDIAGWQAAIKNNTKLLFVESPSNPMTEVADLRALADMAHAQGCLLVVDNCFCSPALQQPIALGADLVIHSATKHLDGQGRILGGAVVGNQQLVGEEIFGVVRTTGPTMSPFNAWVALKGLETLKLRMDAHSIAAQKVAEFLQSHRNVESVNYPGLAEHPQHDLAARQQSGFGAVLSFAVKGGREDAWKVIDATEMLSITGNLGDVKTTITHPATTTHARVDATTRQRVGITESLIRVSVGLETTDDIIADLARGLDLL